MTDIPKFGTAPDDGAGPAEVVNLDEPGTGDAVPAHPLDPDPWPGDGGVTPTPPIVYPSDGGTPRPVDPRPLDPPPWPGDGGVPPIPPIQPGVPRPIDHVERHPQDWLISPKSFVVDWDPRIPLSAEAESRIERQIRKAVLAELAEAELDTDVTISAVRQPQLRGLRVQQL